MATSWGDAGDKLQLWVHIELFKSYVGAFGMDRGDHMPAGCGVLYCLCQLALGCFSLHQWPKVHQIQRSHGMFVWQRNVLHHLGLPVLDPSSWKYGFHSTWRKSTQVRSWLGLSTVLTFAYIVILLVVVVKDGKANTKRDYAIHGNKADRVLNAFGAISAIIVCNTSGLLLEIQSTLRKSAVSNMRKALYLQFSVGLVFYYGVSMVGYWAYGSTVSEYLPKEIRGPKLVKVLINAAVFLQSIVSQHMFAAPIHETLDTKFLKLKTGMNTKENLKRRFYLRAFLFAVNTFVTSAFPFMGDFVNLFGSFTLVPLTFVFPSMIFIKVKGKTARLEKNLWHWFNIVIFSPCCCDHNFCWSIDRQQCSEISFLCRYMKTCKLL